jgi:hypothetical protein
MNNDCDEQTQKLLDLICEGVETSTGEEEQAAAELQDN